MEYEKAWQPLVEKGASRHIIACEDSNLLLAVDHLVETGVLVGQGEMLTQDVIYFLSPERDNTPKQAIGLNDKPLYTTPEERLKRPTVLKNGITRTFELSAEQLIPMMRDFEKRVME